MERDRSSSYVAAALLLVCISLASAPRGTEANIFGGKLYQKAQQDCILFMGINPLRLDQYKKFVYPPDRDTMCLIRCIGISLDFWDDILGFDVDLAEQEFSPLVDATFKKYLAGNITLKLELLDPLDNCARAYYAFRTFRAQILNLPPSFLTSLTKGIITDCPEVQCLIRCAAVRTGLYTDKDGALLANLHRQLDPPGEDLASFSLRQGMCLQRNQQPPTADCCTRAFKQFFTCLRPDFEQFFIRNRETVMQHFLYKTDQPAEDRQPPWCRTMCWIRSGAIWV
uniref:Odorant-binding protein AgamOBP40 n=1 Tax=Anopheles gambiae TaxID=7165 RepID=Q8I8P9_ANOGA|nr:odorant-binding protein AgamOBP40 [Anopheles gambiae]